MQKRMYILGAGFSKGLNAPLQRELLPLIFSISPKDLEDDVQLIFTEYRDAFQEFLEKTMYLSTLQFEKIALEDIYTPIDRSILDNSSFRGLDKNQLVELRQKINALLIIVIDHHLKSVSMNNYVDKFAQYLCNIKRSVKIDSDPFAIISLNWDILIDNAIASNLCGGEGVIDYCCYITPFWKNNNIMPGLLARGMGKFNLKILKLHGSMNWLQCPRCQRLFVAFGEKIAMKEYITKPVCRLCNKNYSDKESLGESSDLVSQLIMPTFLKDLNNVQLKLIWHNASIELAESDEIIFIGYSFPEADFELRNLLAKSVRKNSKIRVILHESDHPSIIGDYAPEYRYKSFFGKRKVEVTYEGVEEYINNLCL